MKGKVLMGQSQEVLETEGESRFQTYFGISVRQFEALTNGAPHLSNYSH